MSRHRDVVPIDRRRDAGRRRSAATPDIDLEAQVVGAVIADSKLFKDCSALDPSHFSDPVHADLWETVTEMLMAGKTITPATLALELGPERLEAMGGRALISDVASRGIQIAPRMSEAAERIREIATWAKIRTLAGEAEEWARSGAMSADEALSALVREAEMMLQSGRQTARGKKAVAKAALAEACAPTDPSPTGIDTLDFLLGGGLIRKRMYGIGGATGIGKTILAGTASENLNAAGHRHLFYSLETPPEDIEIRSAARRMKVNAGQIYDTGHPDHRRVAANAERYVDQVADNTLYEYAPGATIGELHRAIIRASHSFGIEGVIVDYWQLIRGREKGQSEEGHLREVANRLAAIARRENIWILITAQVDQHGMLRISDSLATACSLYMRLVRHENDVVSYLETLKSNYTPYLNTGSESSPGMLFSDAGPHFANPSPEDYCAAMHDSGDDDITL